MVKAGENKFTEKETDLLLKSLTYGESPDRTAILEAIWHDHYCCYVPLPQTYENVAEQFNKTSGAIAKIWQKKRKKFVDGMVKAGENKFTEKEADLLSLCQGLDDLSAWQYAQTLLQFHEKEKGEDDRGSRMPVYELVRELENSGEYTNTVSLMSAFVSCTSFSGDVTVDEEAEEEEDQGRNMH
jgi:hypothetical protein